MNFQQKLLELRNKREQFTEKQLEKVEQLKERIGTRSAENKERVATLAKQWRQRHPDRVAIKGRRDWLIRRARKLNAPGDGVPDIEWERIQEEYNHSCIGPGPHSGTLSMDHIVPLSLGGADEPSNIQPLCRACNARKGTKVIDYR